MAYAQRSAQMLQALFADIGVTLNIETTEFPAKWVRMCSRLAITT